MCYEVNISIALLANTIANNNNNKKYDRILLVIIFPKKQMAIDWITTHFGV